MSFFHAMFGLEKTSISAALKQITNDDIDRIVSLSYIKSLTQTEKSAVLNALQSARDSRGRISMKKIDDVLAELARNRVISDIDKAAVIKRFKKYFEQ